MEAESGSLMQCPECGVETKHQRGEMMTLVGYSKHDDNCVKRYYECSNKHYWVESLRRQCSNCDFKGKDACFCHRGQYATRDGFVKVDRWTDEPHNEDRYHDMTAEGCDQ